MKKHLSLSFSFFILLSILLVYQLLAKIDLEKCWDTLKTCNLYWVMIAALCHLLNHALRTYRWQLLLRKRGYSIDFVPLYFTEMTGFFTNTLGLRAGEGIRCVLIKKKGGVPMGVGFSTIFIERVVDLVIFFILVIGAFLLMPSEIQSLQVRIVASLKGAMNSLNYRYLLLFVLLVCLIGHYFYSRAGEEIRGFLKDFKDGAKKVPGSDFSLFWLLSCSIMALYFLLEYISLWSLKATTGLPFSATVLLFVALNMSHAIPLPGSGAGLYHQLVVLVLYNGFGLPKEVAFAYATITHGIQLFNGLVVGGACSFFAVTYDSKKGLEENSKKNKDKKES